WSSTSRNVYLTKRSIPRTLRGRTDLRFSVPARPRDDFGPAARDGGQGDMVASPVCAGRLPHQLGEAGAERAEGGTADRHAYVGDAHVAAAQQQFGALDPPGHQIAVR